MGTPQPFSFFGQSTAAKTPLNLNFGQLAQNQSSMFGTTVQPQQQAPILGQTPAFGQPQQPFGFSQPVQQQPLSSGLKPVSFSPQQPQPQPFTFGQPQQQQQPSVFGQQPTSPFGQPQSAFGQNQPFTFGQQGPNSGQPQAFQFGYVQPQQEINFGQRFGQPVPQQQFPSFQFQTPQQIQAPIQYPTPQQFQSPSVGQAYQPLPHWGQIASFPMALLQDSLNGRSPSILSADPSIKSPLFNWKENTYSGKVYASGLNVDLCRTLMAPPGSAILENNRRNTLFGLPRKTLESQNNSETVIDWRKLLDESKTLPKIKSENTSQQEMNDRLFRSYNLNYYEDFFGDPDHSSTQADLGSWKPNKRNKFDHKIATALENSYQKYPSTFDNPGPRIGQHYSSINSNMSYFSRSPRSRPTASEPITEYDFDESPPVGLFEHPFNVREPIEPSTSPHRSGPPITNEEKMNPVTGLPDYERITGTGKWLLRNHNEEQPLNRGPVRTNKIRFIGEEMPPVQPSRGVRIQEGLFGRMDPDKNKEPMRSSLRLIDPRPIPSCGVKLTKPKYYCIPDVQTMNLMISPDGKCIVKNLEVGHLDFGRIIFPGVVDVTGLNLDEIELLPYIVHFDHKEVSIYGENNKTPPYGCGLNRRAIVTLCKVLPQKRETKAFITDVDEINALRYEKTLKRSCERFNGKFLNYNPETGKWTFEIQSQT